MIRRKIGAMLNIRSGEWRETFFFWFFNFLLWFGLGLGDSISETLFIKRVGFEQLPLMFIICSVLAIPLSLILTAFQGKIGKKKLTLGLGFISAAVLLIGIKLINGKVSFLNGKFGFYFLYFVKNSFLTILITSFSVLIGTQFHSLKAKRLVPVIFTGSIAGQIAAGISLNFLAAYFPVPNILWGWLAIHAIAFIWFFWGADNFVKTPLQKTLNAENLRKAPGKLEEIRRFFRLLASSKLVFLLILSSFFVTLTFYFADFQSAGIFSKAIPSENDLARFYGVFNIFSCLLAFFIQGGVIGSMIHRFGVGKSNIIYPGLVTFGFIGTFYSFSFFPGIILKFIADGLSQAIFNPVNNLFYNALPTKEKARIISFNEGVFLPLGAVIAGVLILLAGDNHLLIVALPVFIALIWCVNSLLLIKPYQHGLMQLLKSSNLDFYGKSELEKLPLDNQTMKLLLNMLGGTDNGTSGLISQLVINNGDRAKKEKLFRKLASFDDQLRAEILLNVKFPAEKLEEGFLIGCLDSKHDSLVKIALKALAKFPSSEILRKKSGMLFASENLEVKALAAVILTRIGDLDQMMSSLKLVHELINSSETEKVIKGLEVIGFTQDEKFWVNLKFFLASENQRIRLAAAKSLEKIICIGQASEHFELIGQLINDSSREIRFLALKILSRLSGKKWFYHVMQGLSDSSPRNRKLAEEILISKYEDMVSELITVLESSSSSIFAKASVTRILAASQDPLIRDYLYQFGNRIIHRLYEYKIEEFALKKEIGEAGAKYISMLFNERAWSMVKLIVCLVAPEQSREARDLFKSLYSANEEMISNAIEVLQNMGQRQMVYHIIPILENISLEQIASYGMKAFNIPVKEAKVILGKYLQGSDEEMKEAAIFTICETEIEDLVPFLNTIEKSSRSSDRLKEITHWAIQNLEKRGITFRYG